MKKIPKQAYTAEFNELAVKPVSDGQAIVATAKEAGIKGDSTAHCSSVKNLPVPHFRLRYS